MERGTREEPDDRRAGSGVPETGAAGDRADAAEAAEAAAIASYRRLLARASEVVAAAEATDEPELRPEPSP